MAGVMPPDMWEARRVALARQMRLHSEGDLREEWSDDGE